MDILVRLPDSIHDALADLAEQTGRAEDDLIVEAVRSYLDDAPPAEPRSFGLHADPEVSGADSEDWLRANLPRP